MDLKESLKRVPEQPGIYFMKNSLDTIIYVGKAKNLKNRLSQYFQKGRNNSRKVDEMVKHIHSFEYIITDTELEALLLECRAIRTLKPEYNRKLKNVKGYVYIKIPVHEAYPKISKATQRVEDGSIYFGPFNSEGSVDSAIEFINEYYPIKKCSIKPVNMRNGNSVGCLNSQLGTCLAPCRGEDVSKEYRKCIEDIIQFLNGKDYTPVNELHSKMKSAALSLNFERAAKYRDQIRGIRNVINKQRLIKVSRYGRNVIAAERYTDNCIKLFFIKGNRMLHKELVNLSTYNQSMLESKLRSLAANLFKEFKNFELSQNDIDEAQIIYSYLKNKSNGILSFNMASSHIDSISYGRIAELLLRV